MDNSNDDLQDDSTSFDSVAEVDLPDSPDTSFIPPPPPPSPGFAAPAAASPEVPEFEASPSFAEAPTFAPPSDTATPPPNKAAAPAPAPPPSQASFAPEAPAPEPPAAATVEPTDFEPLSAPASAASNPAPGWYPAPGGQRYWDGVQWTQHTAPAPETLAAGTGVSAASNGALVAGVTAEDKQMAMFAHVGQLLGLVSGIGGFLVPLVLMFTKGKESDFVRRAAVESLNFWITGLMASIVAGVLILLLVGIILLPLVLLAWLIFPIIAGLKTYEGVDYRYPFNIRLIS